MKTATKKSSAIVCSFPNVQPINTAEEGIRVGHYDGHYSFITNETVPLQPVQGAKNLHLVCFDRMIGEMEYVELLRAESKQPCRNAPQYLLGLMAAVPEDKMPKELRNKDLVAAEPGNASSAFTDKACRRCFLYVDRRDGLHRLDLIVVDGEWDDLWAFLAEDLVP
ncbi:MAG: hypothetical protein HYT43_00670 [Candidatus Taylorbacteria bacterium]|nr:hypothetical protein [Candidatus Taylorbacteria bacterium]